MKTSDLTSNYFMFGNKGNAHSNTAHIAKINAGVTLCNTPMLSTNHCRLQNIETIGCESCIKLYNAAAIRSTKRLLDKYNRLLNSVDIVRSGVQAKMAKMAEFEVEITLDNLDSCTFTGEDNNLYIENEHGTELSLSDLSMGELNMIWFELNRL